MDVSQEATRQALLLRAHGQLCVLPLGHVAEILRPLPVTPIAGQLPAVLGIALHRGAPVPVVDLARLLGASATERSERFVALRVGPRTTLLAVEAVLGLRDLPESAQRELPTLLKDASEEALLALGRLDNDLLLVLRAARFVRDDVWVTPEAGRTP